jgi:tetratricopeptide (TPR) repeat protein
MKAGTQKPQFISNGKRLSVSNVLWCAVVVFVAVGFIGCGGHGDPVQEDLLELERASDPSGRLTDERIREIEEGIRMHREIVQKKIESAEHLGVYHKMLALEYLRRAMYSLSLEHFREAIAIQTENPVLFYYGGVTAARAAKSSPDEGSRDELFQLSEWSYSRAIELNPRHSEALYGLAVLYAFELDRPDDAVPLTRRVLERRPNHLEARFVLARAYVLTGRTEEALQEYQEIAERAGPGEIREQALRNRRELLEAGR